LKFISPCCFCICF